MTRWAGLLVLAGLTLAALGAQTRIEQPQLISTAQLAQRLNDSNLRIIDARGALATYLQEHLPNALFLSTETLRLTRGGIPGQMLPPERLAEIFGAMGIGAENEVVVYSSRRTPSQRRPTPRSRCWRLGTRAWRCWTAASKSGRRRTAR
jgi:rhodanese-related sulfurtransferase